MDQFVSPEKAHLASGGCSETCGTRDQAVPPIFALIPEFTVRRRFARSSATCH
jgi:hypothetical protein